MKTKTRVRSKFQVRIRYSRGSLKEFTVAETGSKRLAHTWAENQRAALRESLSSDSLLVRVVCLRPRKR